MPSTNKIEIYTTRALQVSLFLLALSAPISIAATQTAWSFALLFWIVRAVFVRPRLKKKAGAFDLVILAFVGLSLLSSVFSYEPEVSLRKMVAVSLVTIVYLVSGGITDTRQVRRMVAILLAACFASCIYTFAVQAIGKNLKVVKLTVESPLRNAGVADGYTILRANGREVNSPDELAAAIREFSSDGIADITVYRHELIDTYKLETSGLAPGVDGLGIQEWSRGRDFRAAGFYGHYTTFAEALQLIASLTFGLLILIPGGAFARRRMLLAAALTVYLVALFLTVTRASWLSFLIAAGVIVLLGASKRTVLICIAIGIPMVIGGLIYLQQKRQVSFFDTSDGSTQWRMIVWREGFDLLTGSPRHLAVGVGMDSIKTHYREWHLFDDGRQPMGHMHSNPLQIGLERGVPALIAWIAWMLIYLGLLWRGLRDKQMDPYSRGFLLGAFGATIGFLTSGIVHYNWGDSEVVMIL
jgi:O-antigen ligase